MNFSAPTTVFGQVLPSLLPKPFYVVSKLSSSNEVKLWLERRGYNLSRVSKKVKDQLRGMYVYDDLRILTEDEFIMLRGGGFKWASIGYAFNRLSDPRQIYSRKVKAFMNPKKMKAFIYIKDL